MNRLELAQELQNTLFAHPQAGPIPIPASLVTLVMEELRKPPAPESPAKEQPWQRTRREVLIEAAMKCRDIQYEHRGLLYENAEPIVKTYHDGMAKGADVCEYAIRGLAESPAKEQPGEQNAAGQENSGTGLDQRTGKPSDGGLVPEVPASAAPAMAAMVKRLERLAGHDSIRGEEIYGASVSQSLSEATALIEKQEEYRVKAEQAIATRDADLDEALSQRDVARAGLLKLGQGSKSYAFCVDGKSFLAPAKRMSIAELKTIYGRGGTEFWFIKDLSDKVTERYTFHDSEIVDLESITAEFYVDLPARM